MRHIFLLLFALAFAFSQLASAKDFPAQARLFAGLAKVGPDDVNEELKVQGLKDIDANSLFGAEVAYTGLPIVDVGLRYTMRLGSSDELSNASATEYESQLEQTTFLAIARVPILRTKIFQVDVFGGAGGSNTSLKIKSATQDGEITKKDTKEFVASFASAYGASVAIGYNRFFLVFEAGMETNKLSGLKRSGNLNTNISEVDLSGPYATIGLLLNGAEIKRR